MSEENTIEISEEQEVETKEFSTEGLIPEELEMAKELGLTKEEEDGEQSSDTTDGEDSDSKDSNEDVKEEEEKEEVILDPSSVEEMDEVMEKDEKKFHKVFTSNAKALYFKMKAGKAKAKTLLAEIETLKKDIDPSAKASGKKLEKITALLESGEDLTVDQLKLIIDQKVEVEEDSKPITQAALKEKVAVKTQFISQIGKAKYDNFEQLAQLADEVVKADTSGVYEAKIGDAFLNDAIDETSAVDIIIKIAKLNDKYADTVSSGKTEEKVADNKVIKNLKKKPSSASIGGSGKRIVSEAELTIAQASKLTPNQFAKLSEQTQERLLMGIDP